MTQDTPGPDELRRCRRAAEWALIPATAEEVGIFEALADRAPSIDRLAQETGLDRRALRTVVHVLAALGLARIDGDVVGLTEAGRARYGDPESEVYEGIAARRWRANLGRWLRLDQVLRDGGPLEDDAGGPDERSLPDFMAAMAGKPRARVRRLVELCLSRRPGADRILDLGGGPGVHSRAFVERDLAATLVDTPETIEYVADAYGLADMEGIELVGGDFLESLPRGPFDIVLLANITHIYDETTNRQLIRRIAGVQRPGDLLAIQDFVRGHSPFAPLFAVTMLLSTDGGGTYGVEEYRTWLDAAGYGQAEVADLDDDRQLITAVREG